MAKLFKPLTSSGQGALALFISLSLHVLLFVDFKEIAYPTENLIVENNQTIIQDFTYKIPQSISGKVSERQKKAKVSNINQNFLEKLKANLLKEARSDRLINRLKLKGRVTASFLLTKNGTASFVRIIVPSNHELLNDKIIKVLEELKVEISDDNVLKSLPMKIKFTFVYK